MVGCTSSSILVADEAVTDAGFGADDLRIAGIAFDLATQLTDENSQVMQVLPVGEAQTEVSSVLWVTTRPA